VEFELRNHMSVSCPSLGVGSDTNLLCFSQTNNRGTCSGDSGGPAFAVIDGKQTVVGVTSFGDMQCADYGADTRVDVEQPFLVAHVPDLIGCLSDQDCPSPPLVLRAQLHRATIRPQRPGHGVQLAVGLRLVGVRREQPGRQALLADLQRHRSRVVPRRLRVPAVRRQHRRMLAGGRWRLLRGRRSGRSRGGRCSGWVCWAWCGAAGAEQSC